jgi:RimJ/RimL family protein N-acetyltransferase
MPHAKMQSYVNIDYTSVMSIVGVIFNRGVERIIAEGRYAFYDKENIYEMAFVVDEEFQGAGIATYILDYLFNIAINNNIHQLVAYVLNNNQNMINVFKKARITPDIDENGEEVTITFHMDEDYTIILKF